MALFDMDHKDADVRGIDEVHDGLQGTFASTISHAPSRAVPAPQG